MIITNKTQPIYIGFKRDGSTSVISEVPMKGIVFEFVPLTNREYVKVDSLIVKTYRALSEEKMDDDLAIRVIEETSALVVKIHNSTLTNESFSFDTYFLLLGALWSESRVSEEDSLFLD